MLSIIRHSERLTLKLSGRLEGSSAEDLKLAACPASALDIDLTGLTSIDHAGERAFAWLRDRGATLHGEALLAYKLRAVYTAVDSHSEEAGNTE